MGITGIKLIIEDQKPEEATYEKFYAIPQLETSEVAKKKIVHSYIDDIKNKKDSDPSVVATKALKIAGYYNYHFLYDNYDNEDEYEYDECLETARFWLQEAKNLGSLDAKFWITFYDSQALVSNSSEKEVKKINY